MRAMLTILIAGAGLGLVMFPSLAWSDGLPPGFTVSPDNVREPGQAGYCIRHATSGVELVYVPGGAFTMGCDARDAQYALERLGATRDMLQDEQPAHSVTLKPYWIGRTEVTVGQWRKVMGSVPHSPSRRVDNSQGDQHPVVGANYDEMIQFCAKLGLQLPTEAQWEYAARGPAQHVYPWGNEWNPTCCINGSNPGPQGSTAPAGSRPAGLSWCGALDLCGNVWELCADWYADAYYARSPALDPTGATEAEATDVRVMVGNSQWLTIGKCKVARGGSWRHDYRAAYRATFRRPQPPNSRTDFLGFRGAYRP